MNKYLIVGLGNEGSNYTDTRHNIGFNIVDYLAKEYSCIFLDKKYGSLTQLKIKGKIIYLLKPTTFMNLSGKAVSYYLNYLKIPIENLLVISDDLNLDFGNIRLRSKGGHGGHNGHRNIIETLNTSIYCRLKFGIGKNFNKGQQANYVLSKWSFDEKSNLESKIDLCSKMILNFVLSGLENTMNIFNN